MDTYEATKTVLSRVKSLDPENASRITGFILIQDQGEQEMIRLAFSPESVLVSYVNQAKACLGISSNTCSTPSTPSSPSPFGNTATLNRANPFSQASPRIIIPNTRFHLNNNPSSPSSPWSRCSSRSAASYAAVVNNGSTNTASGSSSSSLSLPFYGNNNNNNNSASGDLSDEIGNIPVQDQLSFLDESALSPSGRSDSVVFPYGNCEENTVHHRRSCSVNDAFLGGGGGGEDGGSMGLGWRPCLYYSRGFCKNGNTCKFLHHGGDFGAAGDIPPDCGVVAGPRVGPGSPGNIDGFDELLKLKALQQQRYAQQLMASGAPPPPFAYNKCMNFLTDGQRSAAAALMMGDEFNKFGRYRPCRSDFQNLGLGGSDSSASRQIYLTFPADSTFKEEDVSNYFSIYGPVQDVRIPYQQKRMFGFVTFVHPETVKLILAKGNPHFVCDSRVLVKPYKEKGKVPDKKQYQQHLERGDFSGCLSPTGLDSRELYDLPFGARMFYNNQEMMLRRKLEQEVELKQAMEIQGRRLMNLQLMDLKSQHHHMFPGVPSPRHPHSPFNQNHFFPQDCFNLEVPEESNCDKEATIFSNAASNEQVSEKSTGDHDNGVDNSDNKEESSNIEDPDQHESLVNVLPDHLFASPTKSADDTPKPTLSSNFKQMLPNNSNVGMTSLKSNCFEIARFSSGQEAAEI